MMKRLICAVLIFVTVLGNASVCYAEEYPEAVEKKYVELCELRASGHFSFSVKEQGTYYVANVLSLEVGDTVRINATYSPTSSSIYIGLVDTNGKFYYTRATNGQVDITIEVQKRGEYRLAVVNNSTNAVSISGYVYY